MLDIAVNMVDYNGKDMRFNIVYVNDRYIETGIPRRFMEVVINQCFKVITSCTKHCLVTLENMGTDSEDNIDKFVTTQSFWTHR